MDQSAQRSRVHCRPEHCHRLSGESLPERARLVSISFWPRKPRSICLKSDWRAKKTHFNSDSDDHVSLRWEIGIPPSAGGGESTATTNKTSSLLAQSVPPNGARPSGQSAAAASNHPPLHYRTIISNSRIHIMENASLVIRELQPSDQGYYLCQASNNFGSLSSLIKLTVNG